MPEENQNNGGAEPRIEPLDIQQIGNELAIRWNDRSNRISFSSFSVGRARARRVAASRTYLAMWTDRRVRYSEQSFNCPALILSEVMPFNRAGVMDIARAFTATNTCAGWH